MILVRWREGGATANWIDECSAKTTFRHNDLRIVVHATTGSRRASWHMIQRARIAGENIDGAVQRHGT